MKKKEFQVGRLPHDDPRYVKWRQSLMKRPAPWNKGYTKDNHPSVEKISKTFKKKGIDNFAEWRRVAREKGVIPNGYPPFKKDQSFAFLIGMALGDGHVCKHERTESLRITLGTDKPELWRYTAKVVSEIFQKEPYVYKSTTSESMVISIYQKDISKRLDIPCGDRGLVKIRPPSWVVSKPEFLIPFLKGLYEAEGSFNVHRPTYTYKLIFTNKNDTLLDIVYDGLIKLGFNPHRSRYKIQVSRKKEVYELKNILSFREYL